MTLEPSAYVAVGPDSIHDQTVILVGWQVEEGCRVESGDKLCEIETSKSIVEIYAHRNGWLFHMQNGGDEVPVGEPLGVIADQAVKPTLAQMPSRRASSQAADTPSAALRGGRHQLRPRGGSVKPLSPRQRGLAWAVEQSHASIPHGYQSRWVRLGANPAVAETMALQASETLENRFILACLRAAEHHPKSNACWSDDGIIYHESINLGLVINGDNGDLVAPVIHAAETLNVRELLDAASDLRGRASQQKLTIDDLSDGTLMLTSLLNSGVQQILPIIAPGTAVIVSLGDALEDRHCVSIAFDHRIMNDLEAGRFLVAICDHLENANISVAAPAA